MGIARRVFAFVLPPLVTLADELVLLALMDGSGRAKSACGRGYGAGGEKLIELARHLRDDRRVARVVACVLSQDNVSKRSQGFFRELHEALVHFGAAVTGGAMQGVRIELAGRLSRLRAAGGYAAACADDFEAIERATAHENQPTLRLTLAVDYDSDIAIREKADIILRTGMQDEGVVRTSGIDTSPSQFCHGTSTLWPELTMTEIDRMLARALERRVSAFTLGHDAFALARLVEELAGAALPAMDLTLQTASSPAEVCALLDRLFAPGTGPRQKASAVYTGPKGQPPRRFGLRRSDRHVVRIVHHDRCAESPAPAGFDVIVAPGQTPDGLTLPTFPRLGYASVWPCGIDASTVVTTIARAARDFLDSAPLLGAERNPAPPGRGPASEEDWLDPPDALGRLIAQEPEARPVELAARIPDAQRLACSPEEIPERLFVAKLARWAKGAGLPIDDAGCPGATSYLRTAYRLFPDCQRAEVVAKYMILVAVGDVLFDTMPERETPENAARRRAAYATYLREALRGGCVPREAPGFDGAAVLQAIARQWVEMYTHLRDRASGALLRRWCGALSDHYAASVREYEQPVTDNPMVGKLVAAGEDSLRAARAILGHYAPLASPVMADRLARLVRICSDEPTRAAEAARELRVLLYLLDVNTIGAGLAFRTAALTVPRDEVPLPGIFALDATLPLLDFRVRLANDRSGFVAAFGQDRDRGKKSACSLLVPEAAEAVDRAEALMRAVETIELVCRWLDAALDETIDALAAAWPEMGAAVRRGRKIGVKAYEVGHYTSLSADQMSAVLATPA
ncbi:hypothetical protein [Polyangium sp. 6x1]|uniref:hypothetical protein n=1 Tax=Polyangium sp. 6x1 TaxID=3042689 RepID=UPI0024831F17|nr:hypothetical protein [Polyangium sp. 6x1]MDI1443561.1 hypothetical protein [Polyangium sp. 6x1]